MSHIYNYIITALTTLSLMVQPHLETSPYNMDNSFSLTRSNNEIEVTYNPYDTAPMYIYTFAINGPNETLSIQNLSLGEETYIETNTDWLSPYSVCEGAFLPERVGYFTGGWHTHENNEPSSRMIHYQVRYNDSEDIPSITLSTTNIVDSYNTQNPVLKEDITYTIEKNTIRIHVTITALKDLTIERYFGLQVLGKSWADTVTYIHDNQTLLNSPLSVDSQAMFKTYNSCHKFVLKSPHTAIFTWINEGTPLGDLEYLGDFQSSAFSKDYGKSYFNLVNGIPLSLNKGESISFSGGYLFKVYE